MPSEEAAVVAEAVEVVEEAEGVDSVEALVAHGHRVALVVVAGADTVGLQHPPDHRCPLAHP